MKWLKSKKDKAQQPTPSLEQQRSEKLAEMGAQLWTARQERCLSLEEMVVLTKIPKRLLQAIEEGNLNDLPEPIYVQGLIRQFADALGFNGAEFASNFPVDFQLLNLRADTTTQPLFQIRPFHLYLLYIFVIICSVSSLSQMLNNAAVEANNSQNQLQEAVLEPKPTDPKQAQPVINSKDTQSVQIGVTLKASSWIRVVADGKTEFEGVLPEGTHRTWKAHEQLTVKTDNAGGVLMSVNQQAAKQMGEPGKAQEVNIAVKPQS